MAHAKVYNERAARPTLVPVSSSSLSTSTLSTLLTVPDQPTSQVIVIFTIPPPPGTAVPLYSQTESVPLSPTSSTPSLSNSSISTSASTTTNPLTTTSSLSTTTYSSTAPSAATESSESSLPSSATSAISPVDASNTNGTVSAAVYDNKVSQNKGLIGGVAALAALFVLALGALAFAVWRRKRTPSYASAYELKTPDDPSISSLEGTVHQLQAQLNERNAQLKDSQAALLHEGRRAGATILDDRQVNERFARISSSINDWTLTHFKNFQPHSSYTPEVANLLQRTQPNYSALLGDSRTKYLVIRALAAEVIVQAFNSGELIGNVAYLELKNSIEARSSAADSSEWKAQTMALLERDAGFQADRASSVNDITKSVDSMTSDIGGQGYSQTRFSQLQGIVEMAATLAVDLTKQRSSFGMTMTRPGTPFNVSTMNDVLQDRAAETLQDRKVQIAVFPLIEKLGGGGATNGGRKVVISRAQVLV